MKEQHKVCKDVLSLCLFSLKERQNRKDLFYCLRNLSTTSPNKSYFIMFLQNRICDIAVMT